MDRAKKEAENINEKAKKDYNTTLDESDRCWLCFGRNWSAIRKYAF